MYFTSSKAQCRESSNRKCALFVFLFGIDKGLNYQYPIMGVLSETHVTFNTIYNIVANCQYVASSLFDHKSKYMPTNSNAIGAIYIL